MKNRRGFTPIELLIVIAVTFILPLAPLLKGLP